MHGGRVTVKKGSRIRSVGKEQNRGGGEWEGGKEEWSDGNWKIKERGNIGITPGYPWFSLGPVCH